MGKKGRLLFKGDRPKKKSKKSKADKKDGPIEETITKTASAAEDGVAAAAAASTPATNDSMDRNSSKQQQQQQQQPTIRTGTGTITASGTVVTGHGTKFQKEISVGDAILVGDEMRVVTMRLSNASLNLSTAFSASLREPRGFKYVHKPRNHDQEQHKERQKRVEEANAVERNAFDIYGTSNNSSSSNNNDTASDGGAVFTYRERTENGSYRVKREVVSSGSRSASVTRGGLLDLRSKKTSDKYC